ncbi:MAG: GIY-YIG nuclease family protein [bacterium]|nr:GIY-YIG nuclease family protein [bacterium]
MSNGMDIKISAIPAKSGVYFFKDGNDRVLYIGKAANLKSRLGSYKKTTDSRILKMLELAQKLEWQETDTEIEALILESQLIKRNRPMFNIMLRDDKQYFYVGFTKEEYPKIFITHQPKETQNAKLKTENNGSKLKTKKLLTTNYSLPTSFIGPFTDGTALKIALRLLRRILPYCTCKQKHNNFCLNYHIGNCPGFCCLKKTVISSKQQVLSTEEKKYKNNIRAIKYILGGKKSSLIKKLSKKLKELGKNEKFEQAIELQNKIKALEKVFSNARIILNTDYLLLNTKSKDLQQNVLSSLKSFLNLKNLPIRIEGYDIANIQGQYAVGAMVVFTEGKPDKSQYRKFKIKTVTGANDTAMIEEMLKRRFSHPEWQFPDLIIVDGGKGQLGIAQAAILNLKLKILKNTPIIALTKDERHKGSHIYLKTTNYKPQTTNLSNLPPAVRNLILAVDAEAHRFAISYYRKLHGKSL